ncbi:MAG: UDP-glucose/GDP-mannose dehydrogenase family protein [Spirochaetaceae bacterium]|jgi:UDPglucose 6-dehydrogenase|nr:UDP-glucose/GDP-mannose dehydrogenase family protein [Spirochaetaceae bacterium]
MVNITVIGTGYVGLVSGACLADFGNSVTCVDIDTKKIENLKKGIIPIYEPGLETVVIRNSRAGRLHFSADISGALKKNPVVFIAVGTPPAEDGSADLSHVETAARTIGRNMAAYTVVVDKSTVPIGTGRKVAQWIGEEFTKRKLVPGELPFDVVSNPEFLREGSAVQDFTHPDRIIIGSESEKARKIMREVYRPLYLNETPYIETNRESAEMIKYASNAFLAVKITFINEIANLCEKVGADVRDVAKAVGRDGRIGAKFLHPGPGYGGSCFPKDTRALARIGRDSGEPVSIVEAAISANDRQKTRMIHKIEKVLGGDGSLAGKTIAVLGLAFKPNTDDMREAPAVTICEGLAARGAKLRVWDPAAMKEAEWRLKSIQDSLFFAGDEYDAVTGSDAVVLLTEWNQFRNLDLCRVKNLLARPYFFDLRNVYQQEEAEKAGLNYIGVGK